MKFAIVSDIHDHVWNLRAALVYISGASVDALICCGDLCSPFVLDLLASGFPGPIHAVAGNNEGDWRLIAANATKANQGRSQAAQITLYGQFFAGEIGGRRVAVNHYPEIARDIAAAGAYDLVCFGHNHQYETSHLGATLALNPGTLMGYAPRKTEDVKDVEATFAIYDTGAPVDQAVGFYQVSKPWRSGADPGEVVPFDLEKTMLENYQ
jgi:putative phosphoesterase